MYVATLIKLLSNFDVETCWETEGRKNTAYLYGVCICDANIHLMKVVGTMPQK
jgi:hypothetical protein